MDRFAQIQKIIAEIKPVFSSETVSLENALNRVLAEEVLADTDMPPFDKSAMDGFACRLADIINELEVLETIQAGDVPEFSIEENQCSKIMTGAVVPPGADCVFMIEHSEETKSGKIKCTNPNTNQNICFQGEDYKTGTVLIEKGTRINVSQMAVLAGAGYSNVNVAKRPKSAVIATGSELVQPNQKPANGQIRNSNATQLISQLSQMNLPATNLGIVADEYETLKQVFENALRENDFVFFTGGASVGEFDLIPKLLSDLKFEVFWNRTGIKPGNPMSFSHKNGKYVFGLSGNPVSSMMQFELIAKPTIYKLLGASYSPPRIQAKISISFNRKKADRLGIIPVVINDKGEIEKIPFNGSAHINALVFANALLEFPLNKTELKKGEMAYVRPL